jgi:putative acyl-CoA dehydrogenase
VPTHEVTNQAPPLVGYNAFEADRPLVEAVEREGAGWAGDRFHLAGDRGSAFGTLRSGTAFDRIIERHRAAP